MLLQTNFPDDVNKNLKLAKAIYGYDTLQTTLIAFCQSELENYIEKAKKQNQEKEINE